MVLSQRTVSRNSKSPSFQLNYLIHIDDIKPWPPSPQLQSLRSVLIHWENGDRSSGSTRSVTPSPSRILNGGKIEFNESFQLSATLLRDMSVRAGNATTFQKNFLTFNLYEPRRDNILKGQLIGTAIIDLADYGVVAENLSVSASLNCKRSFRNMAQPFLHIRIHPIEKGRAHSSSCESPSMELSTGEHDGESTSASFNEEYAEEADIPSFTENDISSFPPVKSNGRLEIEDEQVTGIFSGISAIHLEDTAVGYENGLEEDYSEEGKHSIDERTNISSTNNPKEQGFLENSAFSFRWDGFHLKDNPPHIDDEAVESPSDTARSNQLGSYKFLIGDRYAWERKNNANGERKEAKMYSKGRKVTSMGTKIQQLECRIHQLEGELREAAALKDALYSVTAEHGSCSAKLHAPAQRLSLLYRHACTELSQSRRASAARGYLSGLILVAKACGNDVPRLTYWLSNCAVLRAILSFMIHQSSDREESFSRESGKKEDANFHSSEDIFAFIDALEKIEAWIFSRVVKSIWWQILIPHMHFVAGKTSRDKQSHGSNKNNGKVEAQAEDQVQANLSLEHWKKAFNEAHGRVCPARAGGHACGCLPVLARLIMEQCTARLDVAMFNAILRKSADEVPADPESNPITNLKVLPIPAGNLSFKAGMQLKHVTGNWSRWLNDHFSVDEEDLSKDGGTAIGEYGSQENWFKPFRLLNALSNLIMLPKDLLLSGSVRKEVCPTLGAPLIWRVLENFIPDEFSPNPVPEAVLTALASEEYTSGTDEDSFSSYPCIAAQSVYSTPSATSISAFLHDDFLKKTQNSDDEVGELTSPLDAVLIDRILSSPTSTIPSSTLKDNGARNALMYELLRDIWMDSSN